MLTRPPVNTVKRLLRLFSRSLSGGQKPPVDTPPIEAADPRQRLSFRPAQPLKFQDGKCLLYRNRQYMFTNWYLFSHLSVPILYLAILIKRNPFFLTFPAALPLMFIAEGFFIRRFYLKQQRYRPIVEEIRLLDCGTIVEVKYANSFTRKLKNLPLEECFSIECFDKVREPNEDPIVEVEFPKNLDEVQPPGPFEYAWYKQMQGEQHLMIPRRYEFADMETLIEVLKGRIVEVNPSTLPPTPLPT